ncbi:MAG: DUF5105 domain-containing protein [Firmicutes bacterium]|nr:DUF5105 domain-containing protein [Bacillota bacterium]
MRCSNCGTELHEGDLFCINCGMRADSSTHQDPVRTGTERSSPETGAWKTDLAKQAEAGAVKKRKFPIWILFIVIIAIAAVLFFFHQAGENRFEEEDAQNLLQAELDAVFMSEYDKDAEYLPFTEEEVQEQRQQFIEQARNEIIGQLEEEGFQVNDGQKDQLSAMLDKTLRKASYTAGDAVKKDKETFTVDVTVKPLDLFTGMDTEFINGLINQVLEEDRSIIDDEARMYSTILDRILDQLINVNLENPKYRGEESKAVRIQKNQDNEWIINQDDLEQVESSLIFSEEFLQEDDGEDV